MPRSCLSIIARSVPRFAENTDATARRSKQAFVREATKACLGFWLALQTAVLVSPASAGDGAIAIQQGSARNYVSIIQARNPFLTRSRTLTVTTGHTTVTEIVQIGPDPVPVAVRQKGLINRISSYQHGTQPNIDVRQDGIVNVQRARQDAMP